MFITEFSLLEYSDKIYNMASLWLLFIISDLICAFKYQFNKCKIKKALFTFISTNKQLVLYVLYIQFWQRSNRNLMTVKQAGGAVHFHYVNDKCQAKRARVKYFALVIRIAVAKWFQRNVDGKWSARKWKRGLQRSTIIPPLHRGSNADRTTDFREYKKPKPNPLLPLFFASLSCLPSRDHSPRGKASHPRLPFLMS